MSPFYMLVLLFGLKITLFFWNHQIIDKQTCFFLRGIKREDSMLKPVLCACFFMCQLLPVICKISNLLSIIRISIFPLRISKKKSQTLSNMSVRDLPFLSTPCRKFSAVVSQYLLCCLYPGTYDGSSQLPLTIQLCRFRGTNLLHDPANY